MKNICILMLILFVGACEKKKEISYEDTREYRREIADSLNQDCLKLIDISAAKRGENFQDLPRQRQTRLMALCACIGSIMAHTLPNDETVKIKKYIDKGHSAMEYGNNNADFQKKWTDVSNECFEIIDKE